MAFWQNSNMNYWVSQIKNFLNIKKFLHKSIITNHYIFFQNMAEEQYNKKVAEQSQNLSVVSLFRSPRLRKHTLLMMVT